MDIKDATATVSGNYVRIYATDGGGYRPIHGAIHQIHVAEWTIAAWTPEGFYYSKNNPCNLDLDLTDWRDQIPWDVLVDEVEWVARDEDRDWWGWRGAPEANLGAGGWDRRTGGAIDLSGVKMPRGPKDWAQAIAKRPERSK